MKCTTLGLLFLFCGMAQAQIAPDDALYQTMAAHDSLLFSVGYNECDVAQFDSLIGQDFTMYHDQSGVVPNRETMITGLREGLCKMDYKASRRLVPGSLEVFPLYRQGELYGALQMGAHEFYAKYPDRELFLTSTAKFTHLWLRENGKWKLANVLSYDHQTP